MFCAVSSAVAQADDVHRPKLHTCPLLAQSALQVGGASEPASRVAVAPSKDVRGLAQEVPSAAAPRPKAINTLR